MRSCKSGCNVLSPKKCKSYFVGPIQRDGVGEIHIVLILQWMNQLILLSGFMEAGGDLDVEFSSIWIMKVIELVLRWDVVVFWIASCFLYHFN